APNRLTLTVHNEGGPAEEIELDAMVLCCAPIRALGQRPHDVKSVSKSNRSARLGRGKDASLTLDLPGLATALGPAAHATGGPSAPLRAPAVRVSCRRCAVVIDGEHLAPVRVRPERVAVGVEEQSETRPGPGLHVVDRAPGRFSDHGAAF